MLNPNLNQHSTSRTAHMSVSVHEPRSQACTALVLCSKQHCSVFGKLWILGDTAMSNAVDSQHVSSGPQSKIITGQSNLI